MFTKMRHEGGTKKEIEAKVSVGVLQMDGMVQDNFHFPIFQSKLTPKSGVLPDEIHGILQGVCVTDGGIADFQPAVEEGPFFLGGVQILDSGLESLGFD